ncbi:MAG TPA: hypothetical protein VFL29_05875 [Candidatus Dormibacteraeota bacterium]|nr:hypothetical protein [Candidatus Dormibacteraeota bacterium]
MAAVLVLAACTSGTPSTQHHTGLFLLPMNRSAKPVEARIGSDPVAVIVSDDGATAYVADSAPGDVYAVGLPALRVQWRAHTGGNPFGLLLHDGHLYVSLFSGAAVVELDPATGRQTASHKVTAGPGMVSLDPSGDVIVAGTRGEIDYLDGRSVPAGHGYAVAIGGPGLDEMWTADYERAELVRAGDLHNVGLPMPLFPFWLAPYLGGQILVAAEGPSEDQDLGGVFVFEPSTEKWSTLALVRDPDQAVFDASGVTYVAAHGDRMVLTIYGGEVAKEAIGVPAVALAPDPNLAVVVVVENDRE